jgi:hypothetical protein
MVIWSLTGLKAELSVNKKACPVYKEILEQTPAWQPVFRL